MYRLEILYKQEYGSSMEAVSTTVEFKVILPTFIKMPIFPYAADILLSGSSVSYDSSE